MQAREYQRTNHNHWEFRSHRIVQQKNQIFPRLMTILWNSTRQLTTLETSKRTIQKSKMLMWFHLDTFKRPPMNPWTTLHSWSPAHVLSAKQQLASKRRTSPISWANTEWTHPSTLEANQTTQTNGHSTSLYHLNSTQPARLSTDSSTCQTHDFHRSDHWHKIIQSKEMTSGCRSEPITRWTRSLARSLKHRRSSRLREELMRTYRIWAVTIRLCLQRLMSRISRQKCLNLLKSHLITPN